MLSRRLEYVSEGLTGNGDHFRHKCALYAIILVLSLSIIKAVVL